MTGGQWVRCYNEWPSAPDRYVRYVSPFGSPAMMTERRARTFMHVDEMMWDAFSAVGALSDDQRTVGPPRIVQVPR